MIISRIILNVILVDLLRVKTMSSEICYPLVIPQPIGHTFAIGTHLPSQHRPSHVIHSVPLFNQFISPTFACAAVVTTLGYVAMNPYSQAMFFLEPGNTVSSSCKCLRRYKGGGHDYFYGILKKIEANFNLALTLF